MQKLVVLIVLIGAAYHFKPGLFSFLFSKGAFDADGNPQVLVFTIKGCGDLCDKAILELITT